MVPGRADHVFLVAGTFDEVQLKPETWLDRDFLKVENAKSIALAGTTPAMNWKIFRETATGPWTLLETKPGEELDSAKANSVSSHVANPTFADVLPADAQTAETGLDNPSTLTIETFDGFDYELRIGKLMDANYPVLVSVKAVLPNERKPAPDEKPEDKARLDQQFQEKRKKLGEKLAREQKLAGRPYLIARGPWNNCSKSAAPCLNRPRRLRPPRRPAQAHPPNLDSPRLRVPSNKPKRRPPPAAQNLLPDSYFVLTSVSWDPRVIHREERAARLERLWRFAVERARLVARVPQSQGRWKHDQPVESAA